VPTDIFTKRFKFSGVVLDLQLASSEEEYIMIQTVDKGPAVAVPCIWGKQDGAIFPGDILGYRAVVRHVGKELDELDAQEHGTLVDLYETFTAEEHEKWYVRVEPVVFDGNGTLLSKYYCGPGWKGR